MQHGQLLPLPVCPHCCVSKPSLERVWGNVLSNADMRGPKAYWATYLCRGCGGVVLAKAMYKEDGPMVGIWPAVPDVSEDVPERPRKFLVQAVASLHAPSGAVMLCAASVDAMLKDKGYKVGSLAKRIGEAAADHLITAEMAAWAHDIRLDANDERHADEAAALPDEADAAKCIEFAQALAQFLYVLPARVERGRAPK